MSFGGLWEKSGGCLFHWHLMFSIWGRCEVIYRPFTLCTPNSRYAGWNGDSKVNLNSPLCHKDESRRHNHLGRSWHVKQTHLWVGQCYTPWDCWWKDIKKPFASKQIILVGEFLQLKPVLGTFDDGEFIFRSRLFGVVIPRRFELKHLIHQNLADKTSITALKELRRGICSPKQKVSWSP